MPSITQESISALCGRKRGREECSTGTAVHTGLSSRQRYSHIPEPATILTTELNNNSAYDRKLLIPRSARHDLKRQRVETRDTVAQNPIFSCRLPSPDSANALSKQMQDSSDSAVTTRKPKVDLSPCHICRRKPTLKAELDAFADCEVCAERTCYICFRECIGPGVENRRAMEWAQEQGSGSLNFSFSGSDDGMDQGGTSRLELASLSYILRPGGDADKERGWEKSRMVEHKRMICSRCCVEKGTEGEVWCFGCLGTDGPD